MKAKYLILTTALMTSTLHAEVRTWTNSDGKTASLELISTSGEGDDIIGTFKMRNGQTVELAAADLAEADAELLKAWKPEGEAVPSVFDKMLDGNLEKLDGKSLKRFTLENKPTKYYLFYYTASWCGPCQRFTPALVKFYEENKASSDEFEIILVSSDRDEKAMEGYAVDKKMNWPHLKLSKSSDFKKEFKHPGRGIPNLVLTDLEGNLLKTSYEGDEYKGPTVVMNHLAELIK